MKMRSLEECFIRQKDRKLKYLILFIAMPGLPKPEMSVNLINNNEEKLRYIQKTYDENLNHKYSPGVKIVGFTVSDEIDEPILNRLDF